MASRKSPRKASAESRPSTPERAPSADVADAKPGQGDGGAEAEAYARAFARLHIWQIQAVRDLLVVAAVIGIVLSGYALRAVTVPLLVALLLAYLFEPLVERLTRGERVSRAGAVAIILGTIGVGFALLMAVALPVAVGQTTQLVRQVRDGTVRERVQQLQAYVPASWQDEFGSAVSVLPARPAGAMHGGAVAGAAEPATDGPSPGGDAPGAFSEGEAEAETITEAPPGVVTEADVRAMIAAALEADRRQRLEAPADQSWLSIARSGAATIIAAVGTVVQIGLVAFLIPFYFFFFSLGYPAVVRFSRQLLPERNRARTLDLIGSMDRVVAGFVRGRIVISAIMGLMLAIGWMICGVPYAIALGFVVGVFCAVPYLGGIGIPAAISLLALQQLGLPAADRMAWWGIVLWPAVVFVVVQLVEGYVLTPAIAGKATNLDPVTIIVAVLAGGSVLGIYGMLLAIPLAACGKILLTEVLLPKVRAWARGERADPLPIE